MIHVGRETCVQFIKRSDLFSCREIDFADSFVQLDHPENFSKTTPEFIPANSFMKGGAVINNCTGERALPELDLQSTGMSACVPVPVYRVQPTSRPRRASVISKSNFGIEP